MFTHNCYASCSGPESWWVSLRFVARDSLCLDKETVFPGARSAKGSKNLLTAPADVRVPLIKLSGALVDLRVVLIDDQDRSLKDC